MPHHYTRRFSFAGLCLLLVFTIAMSGCGKKGPLYLPTPDNTPTQK